MDVHWLDFPRKHTESIPRANIRDAGINGTKFACGGVTYKLRKITRRGAHVVVTRKLAPPPENACSSCQWANGQLMSLCLQVRNTDYPM